MKGISVICHGFIFDLLLHTFNGQIPLSWRMPPLMRRGSEISGLATNNYKGIPTQLTKQKMKFYPRLLKQGENGYSKQNSKGNTLHNCKH